MAESDSAAESDILCTACNGADSEEPNEIVICDVCNQGWHQKCHKPKIAASVLAPNAPWSCRFCTFALGTKDSAGQKCNSKSVGKVIKSKTSLPYDLKSLHWDEAHQKNSQNVYCYCARPGEFHSKMLQCQGCSQWFHEKCLDVSRLIVVH